METGVVKFFDDRSGKRYGFVQTERGEELFFHYNDGEFIVPGKASPDFSGKATLIIGGKAHRLRHPQRDDKIVFCRRQGLRGEKASPWGFQSHHDRALQIIANRPPPTVYRVMIQYEYPDGGAEEPREIWRGTDLTDSDLRREWDPKHDRAVFSGSDFKSTKWFERKQDDGWIKCSDPRQ